jgi:hypothetical protein
MLLKFDIRPCLLQAKFLNYHRISFEKDINIVIHLVLKLE